MSNGKNQEDYAQNLDFIARVEKLKLKKNWTWEEVARKLQMTRMNLHLIRTFKSGVSKRNFYRLEQLEIQEGLRPPGAKQLIEALVSSFEDAKVEITASDFDRGYLEIPIEYARGDPPKGYPSTIRLSRPSRKSAATLTAELLIDQDFEKVVLHCIRPPKWATEEFLNMLTPFSYQALTEAAMAMVFGAHWRQKFARRPDQ